MKYEIKQINSTYAVVISDEEIKDGFVTNGIEVFKRSSMPEYSDEYANKYWQKVIATIFPFKIEGLPMLELPNQEEYLERLADEKCTEIISASIDNGKKWFWKRGFIKGYKAAQKQYSEEDMIRAYDKGENSKYSRIGEAVLKAEFIQSLQKKQFPIAVELTEDFKTIKWYYGKES